MDEHDMTLGALVGGIIIKGIGLGCVLAVALPVKDGLTKLATGTYVLVRDSMRSTEAVAVDSALTK